MPPQIYIPARVGFAAIDELTTVPWAQLRHAYGRGVTGSGIQHDVARSLSELAVDANNALGEGLYSNICHQGTAYEATAYAVPFLAAIAAGDIEPTLCRGLVELLADIALASSFEIEVGFRAGAFGDGVAALIRNAIRGSRSLFRVIGNRDPELLLLLAAISTIADDPNDATALETLRRRFDD